MPLQIRLPTALALINALLALAITAALTGLAVRAATSMTLATETSRLRTAAAGAATVFAGQLSQPLTGLQLPSAVDGEAAATGSRVLWLDASGVLRADSTGASLLLGHALALPPGLREGRASAALFTRGGTWTGYAAAPVRVQGHLAGTVVLVHSLGAVQQAVGRLRLRLWALGCLLAALSVLGALAVTALVTAPLAALTRAARAMEQGALGQRVAPGGTMDTAEMAAAFNGMAERVAALDAQRRAFVADAAHELRTPLAALRSLAEALGTVPQEDVSTKETRETLAAIGRQTERMGRMVESLLTLARLDNPELPLQRQVLRLGDQIGEALWVLTPLARERGIRLEGPGDGADCYVQGDPDWLGMALLNILDNAVRYSPQGGRVQTSCRMESGRCRITVRDDGPGVEAALLPQLGTRFFRPQAGRERSSGGTGLGLAIAREIAEHHGGRLEFRSAPGSGLEVTLDIPASAGDV